MNGLNVFRLCNVTSCDLVLNHEGFTRVGVIDLDGRLNKDMNACVLDPLSTTTADPQHTHVF
jgi:hypothetical protein